MRILLLDGCRLHAWLLANLAPPEVKIQLSESFEETVQILQTEPPDAAVFNITPAELPWDRLSEACMACKPPIPYIWLTPIFGDELVEGQAFDPGSSELHRKRSAPSEIREQLKTLLAKAQSRCIDGSSESFRMNPTEGETASG